MDLMSYLGLISGLILIGLGISSGGSLLAFWNVPSLMITLGGTVAATLLNFPFVDLNSAVRALKIVFTEKLDDPADVIMELISLADKARREGLLALDTSLDLIEDAFLRKGLQLVVDATDPELIQEILETDIDNLESRHRAGRRVFESMATYAPAFGMIGTLIGLIQMLRNIDNPSSVGPAMAVALVTTFYGAMLAYLIFIPIAGKLAVRSQKEMQIRQIMLEGILSIQAGDNPRIVEEKLRSYLAPGQRERVSYSAQMVTSHE
ncbi:MAG: flagellar motor protein [Firmicutes bacterium]|nr:flagellar motor protein [Bacillota bacterium]